MIRATTIEATLPLAEKLASKGLRVRAIGQTPAEKLVQAGSYQIPVSQKGLIEMPISEQILTGSREDDADGINRHDARMQEFVGVIAQTVKNNLHVAKNVVNPIIKEVIDETQDYINKSMETRATHIKVVPVYLNKIFDSPLLPQMVDRFKTTAFRDIKLTEAVGVELVIDNLINLTETGIDTFDTSVAGFMQGLGEDELAATYNSVFGPGTVRTMSLSEVLRDKPNKALLVFLFAKGLMENIPDGINMGLPQYKAYMAEIMAQAGRNVMSTLANRDLEISRKQLVYPYPPRRLLGSQMVEIKVNGYIYDKWLEEGGSPEVIFGDFVSGQGRGYQKLIDNKEDLVAHWDKTDRVLTTKVRLEKFNDAAAGLELAIAKQIADLDEEVLVGTKEDMQLRLKDGVAKLYGNFYDNLPEYARKLVCDAMFPQTDALSILCSIDNVINDFPEMDIREAALIATIEYTSQWVASQYATEYVGVENG